MKFLNHITQLFSTKTNFQTQLFNVLAYYPKDIALYEEALTHKSIKNKNQKHNERLEYLGDAVFGLVIADILYKLYPNKDEGFLTETRAKIVSRKTLNKLALDIKLNELLYYKGNTNQSVFGNALEALVGAIYLDKGYSQTYQFINSKLIEPHLNITELTKKIISYKVKILEWGHAKKKSIEFKVVSSKGKDHDKTYEVVLLIDNLEHSRGIGSSIKKAEELSASVGYKELINR
ncbi:MAG: ribonuclease III [Flavobacteriales bacterium]